MGTGAKVGVGCLATIGVLAVLFIGVVFLVAIGEEMGKGTGSGGDGGVSGSDCIVTNFNVELCGQDAIDHCDVRAGEAITPEHSLPRGSPCSCRSSSVLRPALDPLSTAPAR